MKKLNFVAGMATIIMALTPFIAAAQTSTQTPVNITQLSSYGGGTPAQFGNWANLNTTFTFTTQNTTNANFCQANSANPTLFPANSSCVNNQNAAQATASQGIYANSRWGTYKLNNSLTNFLACSPSITLTPTGGPASTYCLLEFHFHGPSEHFVNSSATDLEVHFVFARLSDTASAPGLCQRDSLLVLGFRMVGNGSTPNAAWANVFNQLSPGTLPATATGAGPNTPVTFNIYNMMGNINPNTAPSYRYLGGLTAPIGTGTLSAASTCVADTNTSSLPAAPPASAGPAWYGNPQQQLNTGLYPQIVAWVLFKQPIPLSVAQVNAFKSVFADGNARGVQPILNSTPIYYANPN